MEVTEAASKRELSFVPLDDLEDEEPLSPLIIRFASHDVLSVLAALGYQLLSRWHKDLEPVFVLLDRVLIFSEIVVDDAVVQLDLLFRFHFRDDDLPLKYREQHGLVLELSLLKVSTLFFLVWQALELVQFALLQDCHH